MSPAPESMKCICLDNSAHNDALDLTANRCGFPAGELNRYRIDRRKNVGDKLWVSPVTGYRRKGTSFSALKNIFIDNVTAKSIFEPLDCYSPSAIAEDIKNTLKKKGFDVAGVKETEAGEVIGYVVTDELKNGKLGKYVKAIKPGLLISDSTPISNIFGVLTSRNFVFILYGKSIVGIITKADINKPPVRIFLFGVISLFEMHLNWWINHFYSNKSWQDVISDSRIKDARAIYEERKGDNQDLSLLECLQFCDKRDILVKSDGFISKFHFSETLFDTFVTRVEKIRNELAHSQYSISSNIEWSVFVETIFHLENFLIGSDAEVEK